MPTYTKNQTIIHESETIDCLYVLKEGQVQIIQTDFFGNQHVIATLSSPAIFAETFALTNSPANVSVIANTTCLIECQPIKKLMEDHQFVHRFLFEFAKKNQLLNEKLSILSKRSTKDKILTYLSLQARKSQNKTFTIPYSRQELADYLCIDRAGLCAQLSKLKKAGLIDYHKNTFYLSSFK